MASSAGNALSLIKAVLELCAEGRTGTLDVRAEGLRTQIYFQDGRPVFAEDEAPGESFGRLLMRQGVLTNAEFVRVLDEMTRAAAGNNQLRFGEVAVSLGVLTPQQVERGLGEQVCGIITRSLQRGESQWSFDPWPAAPKPPRSFSLEVNPAILAGIRRSEDRSVVADLVAARPEELVVTAPRAATVVGREGGSAPSETHVERLAAEQAFQKGAALLREGKTALAAVELRRAAELQPDSLEYLLYATWARARSHREIPGEPEQRALLEIAHQAKKRDPLFAFGSYVIGQLSMWAGDDATAKKWFYEALRLDPASEAGKQVRILARRRPLAPAPSRSEVLPLAPAPSRSEALDELPAERERAPEPTPLSPAQPAVQPMMTAPISQPAPGRGVTWLLTGAALVAIGALAIFAVARSAAPGAGLPPPPLLPPSSTIDASSPVESQRIEPPSVPATKSPQAMPEKDPDDGRMGTVLLPARAAGHRIFVDGRRAKTEEKTDTAHEEDTDHDKSEGVTPLRLRCGQHEIQIGSGGTPETIDLPCGGQVQIE
jgi:hypothetical protein